MKYAALLAFSPFFFLSAKAQDSSASAGFQKNIVKLSATNLFFKNFDIQYERVMNQHWSLAYAVRFQPLGNFPGQSTLERDVNTGNELSDFNQETFRTGNLCLTPEVRYYFGSGYGKGYYLGAFARYNHYKSDDFTLFYSQPTGNIINIPLKGSFDTYSAGLVLGRQFSIGNRFGLDVFLGGHLGQAKGNVDASYATLSTADQQAVQQLLDNIELKHLSEKAVKAEVGANNTHIAINGLWAGFRGGISLIYKF